MNTKTWFFCFSLFVVVLFGLALRIPLVQAQNLEEYVSKYTEENAKGYMQPFADELDAAMNSGLYHNAKVSRLGFHFYLGLETMTAMIADPQKTFTAKVDSFHSVEAPTIFGTEKEISVEDTDGPYRLPGGMNLSMLPIAVPQLTFGSFAGTDLTLRWMEFNLPEDIGRLKVFGWGNLFFPGLLVSIQLWSN